MPEPSLNQELAKYALICLTVLASVGILGIMAVWLLGFKADANTTATNLGEFTKGTALRMVTVLMVVTAATFLALVGALTEGYVALLSGIAGYVLGSIRREPSRQGANDVSEVATDTNTPGDSTK